MNNEPGASPMQGDDAANARLPNLDESLRPFAEPIDDLTDAERRHGSGLAMFHDAYRREIAAMRTAFDALQAGGDPAALSAAIDGAAMTANLRRYGSICGRTCQALVFHHQIEDGHLFPQLRRTGDLSRVVDCLMAEHHIVHALLERLVEATNELGRRRDAEALAETGAVLARLERVIASHFGYEEAQLVPAIGRYGVPL